MGAPCFTGLIHWGGGIGGGRLVFGAWRLTFVPLKPGLSAVFACFVLVYPTVICAYGVRGYHSLTPPPPFLPQGHGATTAVLAAITPPDSKKLFYQAVLNATYKSVSSPSPPPRPGAEATSHGL